MQYYLHNEKKTARNRKNMQASVFLGTLLQQARQKKKMKQSDVAAALDISRAVLSYYENGIRVPNIYVLYAHCKVLDVSLNQLMAKVFDWSASIEDTDIEVIRNSIDN